MDQGYYWCTVQKVNVRCANSPALPEDNSVEAVTGWAYTGNSSQGIPVSQNVFTVDSQAPNLLALRASRVPTGLQRSPKAPQ